MAEDKVYTTSHPRPQVDGETTIRVDPDGGARPVPPESTVPPSGSARAAVEAPAGGRSRTWLWIALAAVIVILAVFMLLPASDDAVEDAAVEGAQSEVVTTGADPVEEAGGTVTAPDVDTATEPQTGN